MIIDYKQIIPHLPIQKRILQEHQIYIIHIQYYKVCYKVYLIIRNLVYCVYTYIYVSNIPLVLIILMNFIINEKKLKFHFHVITLKGLARIIRLSVSNR